jgi:predicted dehydrogenase
MKTAIIGVGRMGRRHIQAVQSLGMDLVGVCDQNQASLELALKENGVAAAKHFNDYEKMLRQTRPECVIVATTAPMHCEYTCKAAESGVKYILCEKPMAVSLEECDRMIKACRTAGARLAVNHQMRFMEQYIEPKRILRSDAMGGLASVTVTLGNCGLAMNGTHYFEMFRYMTDEFPKEVTAWFSDAVVSNPRGPQFQDRAGAIRITTVSGKRFYLDASDDQGHGMHVVYMGRYGHIVVDELAGAMRWSAREAQHRTLPTTRYGMPWVEQDRKIAPVDAIAPSQAVLKVLLEDQDHPTGEDGRAAVAVLVAAYISHESGHRCVLVDDQLPTARKFLWA